jgi:hypothetical protein
MDVGIGRRGLVGMAPCYQEVDPESAAHSAVSR